MGRKRNQLFSHGRYTIRLLATVMFYYIFPVRTIKVQLKKQKNFNNFRHFLAGTKS